MKYPLYLVTLENGQTGIVDAVGPEEAVEWVNNYGGIGIPVKAIRLFNGETVNFDFR